MHDDLQHDKRGLRRQVAIGNARVDKRLTRLEQKVSVGLRCLCLALITRVIVLLVGPVIGSTGVPSRARG